MNDDPLQLPQELQTILENLRVDYLKHRQRYYDRREFEQERGQWNAEKERNFDKFMERNEEDYVVNRNRAIEDYYHRQMRQIEDEAAKNE